MKTVKVFCIESTRNAFDNRLWYPKEKVFCEHLIKTRTLKTGMSTRNVWRKKNMLLLSIKRKWGDREWGSRYSPWDMPCPRKFFLDERKFETSPCRATSVWCLKENKYPSAFHVRRHFLFSLRTWERGKTACGRLGRQTSARLKITFVDMTYPGQRPEPPSLSPHFLLLAFDKLSKT